MVNQLRGKNCHSSLRSLWISILTQNLIIRRSATDERGQKAHEWVDEEIGKLKEHILCIHTERHTEEGDDKKITASFREIFERYEGTLHVMVVTAFECGENFANSIDRNY